MTALKLYLKWKCFTAGLDIACQQERHMQLILGWECAATTELHSAKNIMLQTLTVVSLANSYKSCHLQIKFFSWTSSVTSDHRDLFQTVFFDAVFCLYSAMFENGSFNLSCIFFFVSNPLLFLAVPHVKLHHPQLHADTVPAAQKPIFKLYLKKQECLKRVVLFPGRWDGLCNPELVVNSCLSKSEVMFFFFFVLVELEPRQNIFNY